MAKAITGAIKGLESVYDQRRQDAQTTLTQQTKNAFENYNKYQEQVAALKEEVKKRDAEALSFAQDLTDRERVAIATNPFILETYKKNMGMRDPNNPDRVLTLRDYIGKYIPATTPAGNFNDFVGTIGKQTGDVGAGFNLKDDTRLFGMSAEKQREQMSKLAEQVNVPLSDLERFAQPVAAPSLSPISQINTEIFQKPITKEDRLENFSRRWESAKTPEEKAEVQAQQQAYLKSRSEFDATGGDVDHVKKLNQTRAEYMMIMLNPSEHSPDKVQEAKRWLKAQEDYEIRVKTRAAQATQAASEGKPFSNDDVRTFVLGMAEDAASNAVVKSAVAGNVIINGRQYKEGSPEVAAAKAQAMNAAVRQGLNAFDKVNQDGTLNIDTPTFQVLRANGIDVVRDEGGNFRFKQEMSPIEKARQNGTLQDEIAAGISKLQAMGMSQSQIKERIMSKGVTEEEFSAVSSQTSSLNVPKTTPLPQEDELVNEARIELAQRRRVPVERISIAEAKAEAEKRREDQLRQQEKERAAQQRAQRLAAEQSPENQERMRQQMEKARGFAGGYR